MGSRGKRLRVVGTLVIASALAVAACGSSTSKGASNPTATTDPTPTTSVNVVPTPFQIHQRFATGERWEMTTVAARRSGTDFTITLDVTNAGPTPATFDAATHGLFTLLDEYPSSGAPDPPQHSLSSNITNSSVAGNATHRVVMTFAGLPARAKNPVLWFHGHLLSGTQDTSVWFSGV